MNSLNMLSRRNFVKTTATAIAAAATMPALAAPKRAPWPVGCRDVLLKYGGGATPWESMKNLGADAIEVQVLMDMSCPQISGAKSYTLASEQGVAALKADLEASGCQISAFMMANRLDEQLDQEMEWTARVVKAAASLGVSVIRIDVVPRKLSEAEFLPFAIEACSRMCRAAEGTPVRFGIENHGKITNDPVFLRKLFKGVGSPKLGLTLDIANFYWWGHPEKDLYAIYQEFAGRAFHTHFKSIRYPAEMRNVKRAMGWEYSKHSAPIDEGDIDVKRVIRILRKARYAGDLCVEDESIGKQPKEKQAEVLKRQLQYLRNML